MGDASKNVPSICEGLSILLVDHDEKSLVYLSSLLEQFSYKVTTTQLAASALLMIEEHKDKFKLVIANVNKPDMDPLQFIHSLLDKEIPVILVSRNTRKSYAKKMLAEGASFYMREPIFPDDLKYLWQHAYRNKTTPTEDLDKIAVNDEQKSPDEEKPQDEEKSQKEVEGADIIGPVNKDNTEETENNTVSGKKRQNDQNEEQNDNKKKAKIIDEVQIIKCKTGKSRVVWTPELHLKFTEAISNLGDKKARPKPIMELMNVKNLTARQVASHLQKYRTTVQKIYENGIAELPPATKTPDSYYKTSLFSNTNASSSSHPTPTSNFGTGNMIDLVNVCSTNGGPAMTAPIETPNQVPDRKKQEMDFLELIKSLDDGYKKVEVSNPDSSQGQQADNVVEGSNYISSTLDNIGDEDDFDEWIDKILNMDESEMPNLDLIMESTEEVGNVAEKEKTIDETFESDFDRYLEWATKILLEED